MVQTRFPQWWDRAAQDALEIPAQDSLEIPAFRHYRCLELIAS